MPEERSSRLYPNLIRAVVGALQTIFSKDQYADKVLQQILKSNPKWGSRDRAFIAESVYEIVRWYRLLYTVYGSRPQTDLDWWRIFGTYRLVNGDKLPAWKEFAALHPDKIKEKYALARGQRKIRESIPDWLDLRGEEELGKLWDPSLKALNEKAKVVLRVNTLKTNTKALQQDLIKADIESTPIGENSLLITKRRNLFATESFKKGHFEIQDYSSQQVAPFLRAGPGMLVIDACAGAGGKALHLANIMQNKGKLLALDTAAWKLNELKRRSRRNGVHIIETRPINNNKVIKRLHAKADRLLLDVPCSGLGVIRRNPDAKWKLSNDFIERVRKQQLQILSQYHKMLKPGGLMVYATCSILPSENRRQVDAFLESHPAFVLEAEQIILPQDKGFDGFYMARICFKP